MLKKEVRILGLSATRGRRHRTLIVGVVYRGSLWLDGVLTCSLENDERDENSKISSAIRKSKQYSQLHAVILSSQRLLKDRDFDFADLTQRLNLPVIVMVKRTRHRADRSGRSMKDYQSLVVNGRRVSVLASKIGKAAIQDIFNVACARNQQVPEAVRVANLMTEQVTLKWNSLGLA